MSSRKAKSLFTGKVLNNYISNPREVVPLHNVNNRYFRRLLKREGTEKLMEVIKQNSIADIKSLVNK